MNFFLFALPGLFFGNPTLQVWGPKGSLEFFLVHSFDLCSCSLFYTNNYFFCSCYQVWLLGTLAYKFWCPKGYLEFILEQSLNHCSCSLFYTNHEGVQRKTLHSYLKSCDILRQHRPFNKFLTNLRKWEKFPHVPRFSTSTVKPKSYGDKTQMSFVREACVAFYPTW